MFAKNGGNDTRLVNMSPEPEPEPEPPGATRFCPEPEPQISKWLRTPGFVMFPFLL